MGNTTAAAKLRTRLTDEGRTFTWLARESGLPYKLILREVKHETSPLSLETALRAAGVLDIALDELAHR